MCLTTAKNSADCRASTSTWRGSNCGKRYTVKKENLIFLVPQCNNLVDNITQNYKIILHSYLVQECLGHLELWTEFGDRRLDGERGRVRIVEGGGEHSGAEVEAEGIVR